jgi:hypothetical protein
MEGTDGHGQIRRKIIQTVNSLFSSKKSRKEMHLKNQQSKNIKNFLPIPGGGEGIEGY